MECLLTCAAVCTYMHNASEKLVVYPLHAQDLQKKYEEDTPLSCEWDVQVRDVIASPPPPHLIKPQLPGIGSISGVSGRDEDVDFFFSFVSFTDPGSVWRCDVATREVTKLFTTTLAEGLPTKNPLSLFLSALS